MDNQTSKVKERPWSEKTWFSPCYVIDELLRTVQRGNRKQIQRHKEAWVCAVAVICHSKIDPAEWWIQIPKEDPPDVLAMKLVADKEGWGQNMHVLQVEVFEISEHDSECVEKSIQRKLGLKDYSGMTLVGFVRRKGAFDHNYVSTYIQRLKPKAQSILLVVSEENSTNMSLVQLFPELIKLKHDFGLCCKKSKQKSFIDLTRSTKIILEDATTNDRLTLIPD